MNSEFFKFIVENTREAVIATKDGLIQYANIQASELLGFHADDLYNLPLIDSVCEEDRTHFMAGLQNDDSEKSPGNFEFRIVNKRGEILWLEAKVVFMTVETVPVILFFLSNATEKRNIEKALRESETKYRQLFEYAPAGIYEVDMKTGDFISVNDVMCEYTGYTKEEFLSMAVWDVLDKDSLKQSLERFDKQQKGEHVPELAEYEITGKNKRKLWVLVNTKIHYENHQPNKATVVAHDITERKKLEQEISKAQKLESLGILAGGIAHDFNNLLSAIMGNISLAKLRVEQGEDTVDLLEKALKASSNAKSLTQQLLVFSKGGAPIKKESSISAILKESTEFALRGSKVKCEFNIEENLWHIRVDLGQLDQVIHNLTLNAVQAMPEGGTLSISAKNWRVGPESGLTLRRGKYIKIAFEDRGIGISEKHINKIFDPYYSTKASGSGLGLTMTYAVIQRHNGLIAVESEVSKGTTFNIFLPAVRKSTVGAEIKTFNIVKGKGKILVMDDEKTIREISKEMISTLGYDVQCAADGNETLELYQKAIQDKKPFDTIIMDLTIPGGLGGKETMMQLKQIDPDVRVIVSSGYSNDPIMADFTKYGFMGVVRKPYGIEEISRVLHNVITGSIDPDTTSPSCP